MKTNNIIAAAVAAIVLLTACEDKMFSDVAQLSLSKRRLYTTSAQTLTFDANASGSKGLSATKRAWAVCLS